MKSSSTKKKLPKPDNLYHLSTDGYSVNKSKISRQKSLTKSSKKVGSLTVMRRLNLIRNLTKKGTKQKKILGNDVEFLKAKYKKEKKKKTNKK